jgi:hypothetical protein
MIDDDVFLYNIELRNDYDMTWKFILKVIHLANKNIILVFGDKDGYPMMKGIMKKLLKFDVNEP